MIGHELELQAASLAHRADRHEFAGGKGSFTSGLCGLMLGGLGARVHPPPAGLYVAFTIATGRVPTPAESRQAGQQAPGVMLALTASELAVGCDAL